MRRRNTPWVRVTATIPRELHDELSVLLMDPSTGKMRYGSFGPLIAQLLREWAARETHVGGSPSQHTDIQLSHKEPTNQHE